MAIWPQILILFMIAVIIYDATKFIIPNWLVAIFIVLYPIFVLTSPVPIPWLSSLGLALACFAVGYVMFILNWMGGGDVKFFTGCVLWVGYGTQAVEFFVWMSIYGGALALLLIIIRKFVPAMLKGTKAEPYTPRLFLKGEPMPYGLAIAAGFLTILWQGSMPGLTVL